MSTLIDKRLLQINNAIIAAARHYLRTSDSVKLIAVSKSHSVQAIQKAINAGQLMFGENYVQEAIKKISQLQGNNLEWHFLGNIQSNKIKLIAENFHWVHSLCDVKTAARLNNYKKHSLLPLNVCIQINLDKEPNKAGIYLEDLASVAKSLEKFPHLNFRGLMAIPKKRTDFLLQREAFRKLHVAFQKLQQSGFKIDTLSMGMSEDFIAAIAEGATFVRLGTAIFGKRKKT